MSKQEIYTTLIQSGMTKEAAFGMMGNMQCESGLEPNRVQGDFNPFRTVSKSYTARVNNGSISREEFGGKANGGFGLCQWTFYTRRFALWDFWKQYGGNIDDAVMQTKFAIAELKEDHRTLWETLCTSHDLYTCTKLICTEFERPAHNNIDQRYQAALQLRDELEKVEPEQAKETYWPPRMICKGMAGDDVAVLQAVLTARGYTCEITGEFDQRTHNMTIAFQAEHDLDQDGIAGVLTFGKLLER